MEVVPSTVPRVELSYTQYEHKFETQYLPAIRSLISKDLSEPYSIYVYRYFLCQWAHLCFMVCVQYHKLWISWNAADMRGLGPKPAGRVLIGVIICKLEVHSCRSTPTRRGYIAMLAVASPFRGHGVATALVKRAVDAMAKRNADEVVLETEETNTPAMRLYEQLGFLRSKKLHRYYLNGNSAYRLVLPLRAIDPDETLAEDIQEEVL
ncbi:hypothetical protein NQ176_g295 [Zarea fungicola]|uniref:Uncharacterized protein n=1 Tax=Zarea fungicola TaxID=93591 RepID=A0ACC1NYX6_9HYPO|nr:hypothetical protein NQ176_g295 [Lecanicillium fungicola]